MFGRIFEGWHIVVLILLVVIVFGWKRLPDAARSLGRSARILKTEIGEMNEDGKSDAANKTVPGETVPPQQPGAVPGEAPVPPQQPPTQAYSQPAQQPTGTNTDRGTGV